MQENRKAGRVTAVFIITTEKFRSNIFAFLCDEILLAVVSKSFFLDPVNILCELPRLPRFNAVHLLPRMSAIFFVDVNTISESTQ